MLVICLILGGGLIVLSIAKTEISIAVRKADGLKNNYTSTEETGTTWDVSVNSDGSVIATLDEKGLLTISGTGEMETGHISGSAPWYSIREEIKQVKIKQGVTSIAFCAFYKCTSLTSVEIPESVTSIGNDVFDYRYNLSIICYKDTTAHTYAKENDIDYLIIMNGINPKTTVAEIVESLGNVTNYEIIDKNGETITETEYVGTGHKVEIADGENYIIIVTGDSNGGGEADFKDILQINKFRLGKIEEL